MRDQNSLKFQRDCLGRQSSSRIFNHKNETSAKLEILSSSLAWKTFVFARHADRAKSAVLGTRISRRQEALAKRRERKKKVQKTAPWPVSITRLLWLRQWRERWKTWVSFSRLFLSLAVAVRREQEKPHKENIADRVSTASSPCPSLSPRLPLSPASLFFFWLVLLHVSPVSLPPATPCSLRNANLLDRSD